MSLTTSMRRMATKTVAYFVNDHREHPSFSWDWLNQQCARLIASGGAPEMRPAYTWGVLQAAALARALETPRVSVVEFGVAGGRGLRALEQIAASVEQVIPVGIDVVGFDTGVGLPKPTDVRDHPNLYFEGGYPMDEQSLRRSLARATLVLGDVSTTVSPWLATSPAPVGFVSWDLDYYSSTMAAFRLLDAQPGFLLPRIASYFDDIMGLTFGDAVGERKAIADFNMAHQARQFSPVYGLRYSLPWPLSTARWPDMIYLAHILDHPAYGTFDGLIGRSSAPLDRS
jgi:hypothetical protein